MPVCRNSSKKPPSPISHRDFRGQGVSSSAREKTEQYQDLRVLDLFAKRKTGGTFVAHALIIKKQAKQLLRLSRKGCKLEINTGTQPCPPPPRTPPKESHRSRTTQEKRALQPHTVAFEVRLAGRRLELFREPRLGNVFLQLRGRQARRHRVAHGLVPRRERVETVRDDGARDARGSEPVLQRGIFLK